MGRPPKMSAVQQAEARARREQGATLSELARSYNVSLSAIARLSRKAS
jgi:LysM repeat protein